MTLAKSGRSFDCPFIPSTRLITGTYGSAESSDITSVAKIALASTLPISYKLAQHPDSQNSAKLTSNVPVCRLLPVAVCESKLWSGVPTSEGESPALPPGIVELGPIEFVTRRDEEGTCFSQAMHLAKPAAACRPLLDGTHH